jgi:hypothetical protein
MSWIKRNLFFVVGGLVTLLLLGGAGYYIYQSCDQNGQARDALNEAYSSLDALSQKNPSPGNDQVNNIDAAVEQYRQLTNWIASVSGNFQPIPTIPANPSSDSATFRTALAQTIKQLQDEAGADNVALPANYGFSFEAYRNQLNLNVASLPALAVQLGEVKAIADILLNARVNALDGIQRLRVSDTDVSGPASDYLDGTAVTNDLAVVTPYAVTFRSFTPEIAKVLAGFAAGSSSIIVKSIAVQPSSTGGAPAGMDAGNPNMAPGMMPGQFQPGMNPGMPGGPGGNPMYGMNPFMRPPGMAPAAQPVAPKGGLPTVIKEQMLTVTLQLEVVKLLPHK